MQIMSGVYIYILHQKIIELEEEFKIGTIQQLSKCETRREENRITFNNHREKCVRFYYEYKRLNEITSFKMSDLL